MNLLLQRNVAVVVERCNDELKVNSLLLDTQDEAAVNIVVDVYTLRIKKAFWEVLRRGRKYLAQGGIIERLAGIEAFLGSGPAIRQALEGLDEKVLDLVTECTKGLVQAETYVFKERGYPTLEAYSEKWEKDVGAEYCRYYKNVAQVQTHWPEYIGDSVRDKKLFCRTKNCAVYQEKKGLVAQGSFIDSFHELGAIAFMDEEGRIKSTEIKFLRAPDKVCFENQELNKVLDGLCLPGLNKKELGKYLGGSAGCHHLVDIFGEMGKSVKKAIIAWKEG